MAALFFCKSKPHRLFAFSKRESLCGFYFFEKARLVTSIIIFRESERGGGFLFFSKRESLCDFHFSKMRDL